MRSGWQNFDARGAAWAALLVGLQLLIFSAGPRCALAWSEFGFDEEPTTTAQDSLEIQEPFFEFFLGLVQSDSLGEWSGEQVRGYVDASGRKSRFPVSEIVSLSRRRPDADTIRRYPDTEVKALWRIVLKNKQDRAMPYSILGYHPGSLRVGRVLQFCELALGEVSLDLADGGSAGSATLTEVSILALEQGYVVLDADGWLDALLGAGLDDAWTLGFVLGREEGRLMGLGVSVGREGRRIYGEFDFANDAVLAHGRPLASALSRLSRNWLNPARENLPTVWEEP